MKVKTDCFGEVEILNRDWYNITNYHGVFGDSINIGCIGIITMKDQFGIIKSYIGLGHGISEAEDTILVLDTGVPFYGKDFINTRIAAQLKEANEIIKSFYWKDRGQASSYCKKWGVE